MRRRWALVAVPVIVFIAWLALRNAPGLAPVSAAPGESREISIVRVAASDENPIAGWPIPAASRGPLPESLRGSDVDGRIEIDTNGQFRPTRGALNLFDYFLSASGEETLEVMRGRILLHLDAELPPEVVTQVVALLDAYLAYRESARELADAGEVPEDLERRWQWVRELRREHFGPAVATALFEEEEQATLVDLERRRALLDQDLDPRERSRALAALEDQLPPRIRDARRAAGAPTRVRGQVAALRESGGTEAEVFALREAEFGRDAAARLAALDDQRAEWNQRLNQYRTERDAVLADSGLDEPQRDAALESLRASHFDEREILRVRALDAESARDPASSADEAS